MGDYHEANDEANKAILQELATRCDDAETAEVLSCYSIGATGADIRKEMSKAKLPHIKKAAVFLGVLADGDTQRKKAQIIVDIMSKLNILLKDVCGVCGDYYSVDLHDEPAFTCIICRQGCHDKCFDPISTLFRGLDATHRKALQFVCTTCYSDQRPEDEEIVVNAKKSPMKAKPPTKEELEDEKGEIQKPDQQSPEQLNENEEDTIIPEPEPVPYKTEVTKPRNESPPPRQHPTKDTNNLSSEKPMCPAYEYGRCMNYDTCKAVYHHPKRCRNMLTHGKCRFGNRCRYHHPKICPLSIQQRKCTKLECKLFHIRYTIRYENLSEAVADEGRPHWQPHPPTQSGNQQSRRDDHHNQCPPAENDHFLLKQHITQTNNTMQQLQSLITHLINTQQRPQPPPNQNAIKVTQPQVQPPQQFPHLQQPQPLNSQPPQQLPQPHQLTQQQINHEPQSHQLPQHLQAHQFINQPNQTHH